MSESTAIIQCDPAPVKFTGDQIQRFWKFVQKSDGCWMWVGGVSGKGYGMFWVNNRTLGAHRVSWMIHNGSIPNGMCVCHECDVPLCVNPNHLWLGTNDENMADMVAKGRARPGTIVHPECSAKGEDHGNAKLTDNQVRQIRGEYATGKIYQRALAKKYDVCQRTINIVVNGIGWRHVI